MRIVDKDKLAEILEGIDWYEDLAGELLNDYIFDDQGIRCRNPLSDEMAQSAGLSTSEREQIRKHEKLIEINLPCDELSVFKWAKGLGLEDSLPDSLISNLSNNHEAEPNNLTKDTEQHKSIQTNQANVNDFNYSKLLVLPSKKDAWFDLIDAMASAYYKEFDKLPNKTQAWSQLCVSPPVGYSISPGTDKGGENCIHMLGFDSLGKKAFERRWRKYTQNVPISPNKPQ